MIKARKSLDFFHMKKELLLDCDGVLSEFLDDFIKVCNSVLLTSYKRSDVTDWDIVKCLNDPRLDDVLLHEVDHHDFVMNLKPLDGAVAAVRALREIHDVIIVTAPFERSKTWIPQRIEWLKKHFDISPRNIIFTSRKELICGDVFVDDHPENVLAWSRRQRKSGFLMNANYNQASHINTALVDCNVQRIDGIVDLVKLIT